MNLPRLNITQNGIFYQNIFYKHNCYDFFHVYKENIHFYKSFPNNDRKIFTINGLDDEEIQRILNLLT